MKKKVDIVMTGGIQPEDLIIQCVREPGERVPVRIIEAGEGPADRVPCQSGLNVGVLGDVAVVIDIDKFVVDKGIVESQSEHHQQQTQNRDSLFERSERLR